MALLITALLNSPATAPLDFSKPLPPDAAAWADTVAGGVLPLLSGTETSLRCSTLRNASLASSPASNRTVSADPQAWDAWQRCHAGLYGCGQPAPAARAIANGAALYRIAEAASVGFNLGVHSSTAAGIQALLLSLNTRVSQKDAEIAALKAEVARRVVSLISCAELKDSVQRY